MLVPIFVVLVPMAAVLAMLVAFVEMPEVLVVKACLLKRFEER